MIFESLLGKSFSEQEVEKYVGENIKSYLAYSSDNEIREKAASGGVVSALLVDALMSGEVDGVLVCKTVVINTKTRAKFFIAQTKEEVLQAQGSTYVATKFSKEAIALIRKFNGTLGVVGLPCDITMLKSKTKQDSSLKEKIIFTIALTCGHNSKKELIDNITGKLEMEAESKLLHYRFRRGHWRGKLMANFENKKNITKPFSFFSLYQNLFFFAEKKCLYCNDHFGYDADIGVGDVWSYKLKANPIKHTGLIAKSAYGYKTIENSIKNNIITAKELDISEIVEGQKRGAPFHYNISARHKAGKLFGLEIPDKVHEKVKWHEYITACIVLLNWKWSRSKRYSHIIFMIPRPIMKTYLYLLKGLQSLK